MPPQQKRVVPDSLIFRRQGDTTTLRPQAAPVNTFVRSAPTQEPLKSSLHDLADSLRTIKPGLDRYFADRIDEQAIEDAREAEAKGMIATAKSWDEAIQKGEVPAGASPLYRRVFEETLGKIGGLNKAQTELWQEWVSPNNTIRNTQDSNVIAGWFAERRKKYFEGQSADWVRGFAPAFAQVQQQLTQRIVAESVKYIEQGNHDALGQLFMDRIYAGTASGKSPAQIAADLADDALPHRFAGMQGKEINTIAAKAIIAVATTTGNAGLLQIGYKDRPDLKNPGQSLRGVFSIPEFASAAESARTSILARGNAEETRRQLNEARAEKYATKRTLSDFVTKRIDNPEWEPTPEELKAAVKNDPTFITHWRQQKEAMRKDATPRVDPIQMNAHAAAFIEGIRRNQDVTPIISAMAPFMTPTQLIDLHKQAADNTVLKSKSFAIADETLKQMQGSLEKKLDPTKAAVETNAARQEFLSFAWNYEQQLRAAGGRIDPEKMSADFAAKIEAMGAAIAAKNGMSTNPAVPTPPPALPGPDQQGNAQQPSGAPASVTDALNIVPVSKEGSVMRRWPTPPTPWENPPPGVILDVNVINALRTDPMRKSPQTGLPFWQSVEQMYGPGSVSYFMNNNPQAIARKLRGR